MVEIFKKIWDFAGEEQRNIKKSIFFNFNTAIFHMFQMGAIFFTLQALVNQEVTKQTVYLVVGCMAISIIGKIICNYYSQLQQTHAGYFMAANKRIYIANKMKLIPMGFFNQNSLGNITGVCTTVLGDVEMTAPMVMILTFSGFITTLVFTIYMLLFDWRMGIIAAVGIILFCIITSRMEKKSRIAAPKRQKAQAELVENVVETIQGMSIVKSFNLTKLDDKKVDQAVENSRKTNLAMEQVMTPFTIMQEGILRIFSIFMMGSAIWFYYNGTMELAYTLMFIIISFVVFEHIESVGHSISILRVCGSSIEQANQMDTVPIMDIEGKDIKIKKHEIKFENVHFSYDTKKILEDINLKIEDKTMTAIVGPSGSGKTTICNLIARFWDVNQGRITIDGHDIKEFNLESLMSQIAMVFQNVYLFEDTIENNIRFGRSAASREEVVDAAKKACCHELIMSLPKGYDTIIGEEGYAMSGGERQRISIARAILKDAPIIIFDEATANVDPENEGELQKAFEELTKNKTIIMIAHRIKTIQNANQILVVDNGKIVQRGTHQELKEKEGIYQNFIKIRKEAEGWKL